MDVIQCFKNAEENLKQGIEAKILERYGNENFIKFNSHTQLGNLAGVR
jgi:hypothetical protein